MKKNDKKLSNIILPNKKINFFVFTILILGLISGSIFLLNLNETDKHNTILQINNFVINLSKNKINIGQALKSSIIINYIFIFLIWVDGLSIIGVIFNIFLMYIKGFILGFSLSGILLCYKYSGLLLAIIYVLFGQLLSIIIIGVLTIYSIMFTKNFLNIIFSKTIKKRNYMIKKYTIILIFSIIFIFIASIFEVYVFPNVLKMIISFYV